MKDTTDIEPGTDIEATEQASVEPAAEQVADQIEMPIDVPAAEPGGFQVRSEFAWTKLEFAPLVWQYDKEPETVDVRDEADTAEPTTVDVRDEAVRSPRRRKARR
jgi:hypothetical protein